MQQYTAAGAIGASITLVSWVCRGTSQMSPQDSSSLVMLPHNYCSSLAVFGWPHPLRGKRQGFAGLVLRRPSLQSYTPEVLSLIFKPGIQIVKEQLVGCLSTSSCHYFIMISASVLALCQQG